MPEFAPSSTFFEAFFLLLSINKIKKVADGFPFLDKYVKKKHCARFFIAIYYHLIFSSIVFVSFYYILFITLSSNYFLLSGLSCGNFLISGFSVFHFEINKKALRAFFLLLFIII